MEFVRGQRQSLPELAGAQVRTDDLGPLRETV